MCSKVVVPYADSFDYSKMETRGIASIRSF